MSALNNNPFDFSGVISKVGERQEIGQNGFVKREFVVSEDPNAQYPKHVLFTLKKGKSDDKTNLVKQSDVGRTVKVTAFVESRNWKSKTTGKTGWTTEVTVWKLDFADGDGNVKAFPKASAPAYVPTPPASAPDNACAVDNDALPF